MSVFTWSINTKQKVK